MKCTAKLGKCIQCGDISTEKADKNIRKWVNVLLSVPKKERAKFVADTIDELLAKTYDDPRFTPPLCSSCTSSFCCHQLVHVSQDEMEYIKEAYPAHVANAELAVQQAKLGRESIDPQEWADRVGNTTCIYLDTETSRCKIYDRRPAVCRSYFVYGNDPAEICKEIGKPVRQLVIQEVEYLISAHAYLHRSKPLPWRYIYG